MAKKAFIGALEMVRGQIFVATATGVQHLPARVQGEQGGATNLLECLMILSMMRRSFQAAADTMPGEEVELSRQSVSDADGFCTPPPLRASAFGVHECNLPARRPPALPEFFETDFDSKLQLLPSARLAPRPRGPSCRPPLAQQPRRSLSSMADDEVACLLSLPVQKGVPLLPDDLEDNCCEAWPLHKRPPRVTIPMRPYYHRGDMRAL